jgi:hypothetical protein
LGFRVRVWGLRFGFRVRVGAEGGHVREVVVLRVVVGEAAEPVVGVPG